MSSGGKDSNYTLSSGSLKLVAGVTAGTKAGATAAKAKIGAKCAKVGSKAKVTISKKKKVTLTCKKVKKKLVWSR